MFVTDFADLNLTNPDTFATLSEKTTAVNAEPDGQSIWIFSLSVPPTRVFATSHVEVEVVLRSVGTMHVAASQLHTHALLVATPAPAAAKHQPNTTSVRRIVRRIVHRTSFTKRGLGIPIPFDASHRPNRASPRTRGLCPATASVRSESLGAVAVSEDSARPRSRRCSESNEDGSDEHASLATISRARRARARWTRADLPHAAMRSPCEAGGAAARPRFE